MKPDNPWFNPRININDSLDKIYQKTKKNVLNEREYILQIVSNARVSAAGDKRGKIHTLQVTTKFDWLIR